MKVAITSLELKGLLKFFVLARMAMDITRQLKTSPCLDYKKTGFWAKHYTMTLWNNENELKEFAKSGEHLSAMKRSREIATEIRILTIEADKLPSWKEAKGLLLANGKVLNY